MTRDEDELWSIEMDSFKSEPRCKRLFIRGDLVWEGYSDEPFPPEVNERLAAVRLERTP